MRKHLKRKISAFTLIELVIVIAILAILMAIAIPKFQSTNERAKITAHNANVRSIENAAILWKLENPSVMSGHDYDLSDIAEYLNTKKDLKAYNGQDYKFRFINDQVVVTPGLMEENIDQQTEGQK